MKALLLHLWPIGLTTGLCLLLGIWARMSALRLSLRAVAIASGTAAALLSAATAERDARPPQVLVLADVSASVTDEDLAQMGRFIDQLVYANPAGDVEVLPFAARPLAARPFTVPAWRRFLRGLRRDGEDYFGTDLSAVLAAAGSHGSGAGERFVVLITDGHRNAAASSPEPALRDGRLLLHPLPGRPARPRLDDFLSGHRARPATDLLFSVRVHGGASGARGTLRFSAAGKRLDCADGEGGALRVSVPAGSAQAVACRLSGAQTRGWDTGLYQLSARLSTEGGESAEAGSFLLFESDDAPLLLDVPDKDRRFWSEVLSGFPSPKWQSTRDLVKDPPKGRTPVIVLDAGHAQLDGAPGEAAARLISRNVQAGDWLLTVQGNDPFGIDRLMSSQLAGFSPLMPLRKEAAGRQALAAILLDASTSMATKCDELVDCRKAISLGGSAQSEGSNSICLEGESPRKPGASGYADSFAVASAQIVKTVEGLQPSDHLLLYLFNGKVKPLLAAGPDGRTIISDPRAESRRIQDALLEEAKRLMPDTNLCGALHSVACSLRPWFSTSAGGAAPVADRGSVFIVTDAFRDNCAQKWVAEDRTRHVAGQSPLDCGPNAPTPSLGSAVEHLEAMGITPLLILVDPCGLARAVAAEHCTGELHAGGVKNLCYVASSNQLRYAGQHLPVYAWWRPNEQNQLTEFFQGDKAPLRLPVSPTGTRLSVAEPAPFLPRCAPDLKVCRDGQNPGSLVVHPPARACRLENPRDRALLFEILDSGNSKRPVAAARRITSESGISIAVATDPGTSYEQASPAGRADLVAFWRSVLRERGASQLGHELFVRIVPRRGDYRLDVAMFGVGGGEGAAAAQPTAYLRSNSGSLLAEVSLTQPDYLFTGALAAAALGSCHPCRLSFSTGEGPNRASATPKDWPTLKVYAAAHPIDRRTLETDVEGAEDASLSALESRLLARRLDKPVTLGLAAAGADGDEQTAARSSWSLLWLALSALLLEITLRRLAGWRRGSGRRARGAA